MSTDHRRPKSGDDTDDAAPDPKSADNVDDHGDDDDDVDDDLIGVVPVALATPRTHEPERRLSEYSFHQLLGRRVVLRVNGFDVAGEFRGADENDVYLRGELRWFVYPMSSVTSVRVIDDDDDDDDDNTGNDDEEDDDEDERDDTGDR